jgi:hypothetical protein
MFNKTAIVPELRRKFAPPFAWVDRRLLFDGFVDTLAPEETVLYFFLVLAADNEGLSFYGYEKICERSNLTLEQYISARDGLIAKELIAFDGRQFQVLALPPKSKSKQHHRCSNNVQTLREALKQLAD